jgi:hypothetical protein
MAQRASLRQYISAGNNFRSLVFPRCVQPSKLIQKKETQQEIRRVSPIDFAFTGAEMEIHTIKDDSKINTYGERLTPPRPPFFLVTDYLQCNYFSMVKILEHASENICS